MFVARPMSSFQQDTVVRLQCYQPYAIGLLATMFLYLWLSQSFRSGVCLDESAHIPAGVYHLQTGQMDAYRVNPPLPRMVATIPLLFFPPNIQWKSYDSPYIRSEYRFANEWLNVDQQQLRTQLFVARMMMLLFFSLGLWSIVRWANAMYGSAAAWLAGCMWSFNPDVITYSAVVAPDLPAAASGLFCGYHFWSWLQTEARPFPWIVATTVALAILCKFTWLFLLPTLPLIVVFHDAYNRRQLPLDGGHSDNSRVTKDAVRLFLSFSWTLVLINSVSGFDGTGTRLGDFEFISTRLVGVEVPVRETGNRFAAGPLAWLPVPLPKQMVLGLDYLQWEFERGMPCYLNREWKNRGWWYFYLYAMAVKIPLGYWLLITIGLVTATADAIRRWRVLEMEWLPILFAVTFISVVSSQTGFTHHVRYVLPAYGFLFLLASRSMVVFGGRWRTALAVGSLAVVVVSQASQPGLSHTYFNAAVGPNDGWRHLGFSNIDWGQSSFRMLEWIEQHPEQRPLTVLFANPFGPSKKTVEANSGVSNQMRWRETFEPFRKDAEPGWYLMSSMQFISPENEFFQTQEIVARPFPDVLLFHISKQ